MLNFSDKTGLFLVTLKGEDPKRRDSQGFFIFIREKLLTKSKDYNIINSADFSINGGIAQLARAFGSYPKCRRFKSYFRYYGPVVKRLRHRPFTAVTRVRFSSGSPPLLWQGFNVCRCGGIGRHKGLKIPRTKHPYRFKSGHRHYINTTPLIQCQRCCCLLLSKLQIIPQDKHIDRIDTVPQ